VDKGKNPYDNLLLNLCRGNDLFIVNGRICDTKEGNFTCRNVNNFNDLSEKLNNINPEEINQDFINTCTSDLCHLFISAAKNVFFQIAV
jgi:hypothetical protein